MIGRQSTVPELVCKEAEQWVSLQQCNANMLSFILVQCLISFGFSLRSKSRQKRSLPGLLTFSLEGHGWHSTLVPESKS